MRGSAEREKGRRLSSSAKSGKYSSRAIVRSKARPGAPGETFATCVAAPSEAATRRRVTPPVVVAAGRAKR